MNRHLLLLLPGIVALQTGCNLAPRYTRPEAPVPSAWPTGAAYAGNGTATGTPEAQSLPWREFLGDAKLQQLVEMALTNNRDLRLAVLNVERARAYYGIRRADLLPAVNLGAVASRQRVPGDLSGGDSHQTVEQNGLSLGVASWEIDFAGRLRSLKDRALEEYLATAQARRSAEIMLVSSVANAYLVLAADRERASLAATTLKSHESSYNLVKRRHEYGLVAKLDLHRAQAQADAAREEVARFTQLVAQDENALNLLLGVPAPPELLAPDLATVTPPATVSPGLSSEVLLTRPDILQAESLLKAANADIGAARAAFFPRLSLTAAAGTASSDLAGLFKSGSGSWSYAPQMVAPLFDARTWSAYTVAKVQREMAVTHYEKTIQVAFREVADALAQRGTMDRQLAAQQSLVHALQEATRLSTSRYDKGLDSYLGVLDAQRSLYLAQQVLLSLRLAQTANAVTLYRVLAGEGT